MPKTKSAKKALRQSQKRRLHNLKIKKNLRALKKAALLSLTAKDKAAPEKVKKAIIAIDKAAKRNVIHKNKAARLKSKLTKKLKALKMALPKKPVSDKGRSRSKAKKAPVKNKAAKKTAEKRIVKGK